MASPPPAPEFQNYVLARQELRFKVDRIARSQDKGFISELSHYYHDLPSVMANLISDEAVETDATVLYSEDWLLLDLGTKEPMSLWDTNVTNASSLEEVKEIAKANVILLRNGFSHKAEDPESANEVKDAFSEWERKFNSESTRIFIIQIKKDTKQVSLDEELVFNHGQRS